MQPGIGYTFTNSSQGNNLNISQAWQPFTPVVADDGHPFKIVNVSIVSNKIRYQVQSGTLNNLVPVIDDVTSGTTVKLDRASGGVPNPPTAELSSGQYDATTKTCYIALRAGIPSAGGAFPDTSVSSSRYPLVVGGNDPLLADTDTYGYLFIGTITVDSTTAPTNFTVNQFVTGSLYGDRLKLGTLTAKYYYARV
jgi:hypothetical protein